MKYLILIFALLGFANANDFSDRIDAWARGKACYLFYYSLYKGSEAMSAYCAFTKNSGVYPQCELSRVNLRNGALYDFMEHGRGRIYINGVCTKERVTNLFKKNAIVTRYLRNSLKMKTMKVYVPVDRFGVWKDIQ